MTSIAIQHYESTSCREWMDTSAVHTPHPRAGACCRPTYTSKMDAKHPPSKGTHGRQADGGTKANRRLARQAKGTL